MRTSSTSLALFTAAACLLIAAQPQPKPGPVHHGHSGLIAADNQALPRVSGKTELPAGRIALHAGAALPRFDAAMLARIDDAPWPSPVRLDREFNLIFRPTYERVGDVQTPDPDLFDPLARRLIADPSAIEQVLFADLLAHNTRWRLPS